MNIFRRKIIEIKHGGYVPARRFGWNWKEIHYNRVALVNRLTSCFPTCRYLEIGCDRNQLFDSVYAAQKTGVDPTRGGTVRATSDDFFASNQGSYDVVFIDGLHVFEQVRRDVVNAIKCLAPGGFIALHDMLPRNWWEEHVPRISPAWTGDVWKVACELSSTDGVDFRIVGIDHGVGVLRLSTGMPVLADLRQQLKGKRFAYFRDNFASLPVIDWEEFDRWLVAS